MKDRNESLGKWSTVLGEAAYKKNTTLHRAINKVLSQVVFSMLPRKRYLAEQKRITLRKESNVQTVKKKIHPLIWPLGWMIPVLKMTFLNKQTQDNFLWLTYKWQLQFKTPTNENMPSMNVSEKTKKATTRKSRNQETKWRTSKLMNLFPSK